LPEDYNGEELFRGKCLDSGRLTEGDKLLIQGAVIDGWLVRFLGTCMEQVEGNLAICQNLDYSEMPKANIVAAQLQGRTSALYSVVDAVFAITQDRPEDEDDGT
tara:strand:+ start:5278 stop:5589 length:312 start_codon:yes stop_codon:yes gene_type:complete